MLTTYSQWPHLITLINCTRYQLNQEYLQLEIPLDFDHLLRANRDGPGQWEHLIRVSDNITAVSPLFEKILFKSRDPAAAPGRFLGGHYILPRNPEKPDPKKIWVKIKCILGKEYLAATKAGGMNIITLDTETIPEDEQPDDQPKTAQTEPKPSTSKNYEGINQNLDCQPKTAQIEPKPSTSKNYEGVSQNLDQTAIEPFPFEGTLQQAGTCKQLLDKEKEKRRDHRRGTSPDTQMPFSKHISELLKQTPSLAVIKEKSSIIHTYYITTTDQRFHPKRAVEFLNTSNGSVIPLYRCKISLLALSGLYDKIRLANQKPNKFWKPYPKDGSFQLLTMPLSRKMSNNILTTVFCTP
jgi:hypothetical protein